jgi:N-dimethylarginine dimethylaminohydrolase
MRAEHGLSVIGGGSPVESYGSQSMVAPLRMVMVKTPDESFVVDDPTAWHYTARPDLAGAREEHEALVGTLRSAGVQVVFHDESLPGKADSIYVFDPAIVTDAGAVILRMGKSLRRGEEDAMERQLVAAGVPILDKLSGEAVAEGGDLLWLDERTLAVGVGFRTNLEGVNALERILGPLNIDVIRVDLPFWEGPNACLHLLSLISLVDDDLAVVYKALLPVRFWQVLEKRGFDFVEVPSDEFSTMGPNVLALAPRKCLMLEGNSVTQDRLEQAGCEVVTYKGDEISRKAEGGPTCLTRPIWRRF